MSFESNAVYFISKSGNREVEPFISVYYAPDSDTFVVPKQVLKVQSASDVATGSLWKLITGEITNLTDPGEEIPILEPATVERIESELDEFLRTHPADELMLDEQAPDEIKNSLKGVQDTLAQESQTILANMLGIILPQDRLAEIDDRPYPGQYL